MSTPTPPEGYRIVEQSEIPIVPEGAIFLPIGDSAWLRSANIGIEPISASNGTYAIPIAKDDASELAAMTIKTLQLENKVQLAKIHAMSNRMQACDDHVRRVDKRYDDNAKHINEQASVIDHQAQTITSQANLLEDQQRVINQKNTVIRNLLAQFAELKQNPPIQINARDNLSDDVEVLKHVVFDHTKALKAIKEAMKGI